MTSYYAFRCHSRSTTKGKLFRYGIEFLGTSFGNSAELALLSTYQKYDDENYFPSDDGMEIRDCDGHTTWEKGDPSANLGDYVYIVYTREELNEPYNEKELAAVPEMYL